MSGAAAGRRRDALRRLLTVFGLELRSTLGRPMLWILAVLLAFLAWGMSTGNVMLGTGTAMVGGKKAWLTSEFSNAFVLAVVGATFYSFFAAIAAGLTIAADDEARVGDLLHSTPLTAGEYVWGKTAAQLAAFTAVLGMQLAGMIAFNHLVPAPEAADIRGPLHLAAYLRPAVVFTLPTLVFYSGVAFWLGARWRRAAPVFLLPIAVLFAQLTLLWNWSPSWLDPRLARLLVLLDPSGFRWLNETWLRLDRGADFYNLTPVGLDGLLVANRLWVVALGLGAVALAHRRLARGRRLASGEPGSRKTPRRGGWLRRRVVAAPEPSRPQLAAPPLPATRRRPPAFGRTVLAVARAEAAAVAREPAFYLFSFFILVQVVANSLVSLGAFQTPLLVTPGAFAASSFNTLSLLLCLLLMFFLVDSLARERVTRIAPLVYGSPPSTAGLVAGKVLGVSGVGAVILVATFTGGAVVQLVQGRVGFEAGPFVLLWGLLLVPTLLCWTAFVAAVQALFDHRLVTYGAGLGVVGLTLYRQLTEGLTWVGNWLLWDAVAWSDLSVLELDRRALVLNRVLVLGLAIFFFVLAVRAFPRRRRDPVALLGRLQPRALVRPAWRLAVLAVPPLVAAGLLWVAVLEGHDGEAARKAAKDYWRHNVATWADRPSPALAAVDLDVDLEPAVSRFAVRGRFELVNPHPEPLAQLALTGAPHWRDVEWTLDGAVYEPENRSHLYVFTPERPLAPGGRLPVGFAYHGRLPDGISEKGGGMGEFILPSGVVLTSFGGTLAPLVGYREEVGVDDDNRTDPPVHPEDRYQEVLPPALGVSPTPFTTRIAVTAPADLTVNAVGTRVAVREEGGRRTTVWESDHPVRFFNLVAGRWAVERGEGAAVFYHPAHPYNVPAMTRVLAAARRHYSAWFSPYPWKELKLSEFPALAGYAQGFATNIPFAEGMGFLTRSDPRADAVLLVTGHEAAHQWWGNLLVPGDGPGAGVLSEGMAHFSTALLFEELAGERGRREFLRRLEERYAERRRPDAERALVRVDGLAEGDITVTYDKGGWVMWMLCRELGREACLEGLSAFIHRYREGPDHPLIEDLLATLRPYAPDPERFDRFAEQWFFEVAVPDLEIVDAALTRSPGEGWRAVATVRNRGTGEVEVAVAAVRGEPFDDEGRPDPAYRSARRRIALGPGAARRVGIACGFEPERIVVDPEVELLQLRRSAAAAELRTAG